MGALNALAISRITEPGFYADGGGLYLQIGAGQAKSWVYRFTLQGKQRYLGLGSASAVTLKRARELADAARKLRAEGIDPIEARRAERLEARVEAAKTVSFKECADAYVIAHEASWRNAKHRQQWSNTLKTYVYPVFGALPVKEVDTGLILKALEPIWLSKPETASRVRGRIECILDWATAREYRTGTNPAAWRGHLRHLLPAKSKTRKVEHHAALPFDEIPAFMADLRGRQSISARCLEFTILTAARTTEAIGATWAECKFETGIWAIRGARMKGGLEHKVPLAPAAVSLLEQLYERRESEYVFPGMRAGQPLSNMSMLKMLALTGRGDLTVHGFRSTFTDWAHERTNFPEIVIDMALAHKPADKVQAAYRRGDLFEKRRALMEAWAAYCAKQSSEVHNVIPLHAAQ
jgi:integrase